MAFARIAGNPAPDEPEEVWFEARDGLKLRVMIAPARGPARGSVILCQGWKEFIEKYFEVARELQARGFVVFAMDWRGQGLSGRQTRVAQKSYLRSLDDPGQDLADAVRRFADRLPRPHILLAHSMGGGVTLRALQTKRLTVDGALFNAPMWAIQRLTPSARGFARFMRAIGLGRLYAPGAPKAWSREAFATNYVTHDAARHARTQDLIEANSGLAIAGASLAWVAASADAIEGFDAPDALSHLHMPIVILSAEEEKLVDNRSHARIAARLPDAMHVIVPGAFHEIMMETDAVRAQFWSVFDAFADRIAPRKAA